jgi:hypothetical protein
MTRLDDLKQRINKCKTAGEIKTLMNNEFLCINCTNTCNSYDCTTGYEEYYAKEIN